MFGKGLGRKGDLRVPSERKGTCGGPDNPDRPRVPYCRIPRGMTTQPVISRHPERRWSRMLVVVTFPASETASSDFVLGSEPDRSKSEQAQVHAYPLGRLRTHTKS